MADGLLQLGFTLSRFKLAKSVSVDGRKGIFHFLLRHHLYLRLFYSCEPALTLQGVLHPREIDLR